MTVSSSEGALQPGVSGREICVAYVYPAGTAANDQTMKLERSAAGETVTTGSPCFTDGRPSNERRVQVSGLRKGSIQFFFGTLNPSLGTQSVAKFEAA